jgi:hypothetical protein
LGTELLSRLCDRAREEGVRRFTALASRHNSVILRLLTGAGARVTGVDRDAGTLEIEMPLASGGLEAEVEAALRALGPLGVLADVQPFAVPSQRRSGENLATDCA